MTPLELTNFLGPLSIVFAGIFAYVKWRKAQLDKAVGQSVGNRQVTASDNADIRDTQMEIIADLRADNADLRRRLNDMQLEIDRLRGALAAEVRNRETALARMAAESETRARLAAARSAARRTGAGDVADSLDDGEAADEVTITEAGDAAAWVSRDRPPDEHTVTRES